MKEKKKQIRPRKKLSRKMILWIISCMTIFSLALLFYLQRSVREMIATSYYEIASRTSQITADMIDGDKLYTYIQDGEIDPYYDQMRRNLNKIKADAGCSYLYLFYPEDEYFTYIIEAKLSNEADENIASLGDKFYYGEVEKEYLLKDVKNKTASAELVYGDNVGFGRTVSAWAPILDSEGNLAGMVEADYTMPRINAKILEDSGVISMIMLIETITLTIALLGFLWYRISRPLKRLTDILSSYQVGEGLAQDNMLHTNDEIETMYEAFQDQVERTEHYMRDIELVTAEKERIGAELNIATHIQQNLLPQIFPPFPERKELDLFAVMHPAKEVGGDLYDFFMVDSRRLAVVVADVSGKGVPAALFMAITKTLIKNHIAMGESAVEAFQNINNQLCEGNKEGFFVTAWLGIIDLVSGDMEYVNAGHNPPLIIRKDHTAEWVKGPSGLVLAAMENMTYGLGHLSLQKGDRLFLYTDGVTEANNCQQEMYGEDRLEQTMSEDRAATVQEAIEHLMVSINEFVGDEEPFDDITILGVEI